MVLVCLLGLAGPGFAAAGAATGVRVPPPDPVAVDLRLPAHPSAADLARVQRLVASLSAEAAAAARGVEDEASRQAYLTVELGDARDAATRTHRELEQAVRAAYESGGGSSAVGFLSGISPADSEAGRLAKAHSLRAATDLLADSRSAQAQVAALEEQAGAARVALLAHARPVEAVEARAETALDEASRVFASDQQALAALAAQRAELAATTQTFALSVTPAVTASGRAAAAAQAPVLALLEATPPGGVPRGFRATGTRLTGISSWYGPGFVGSPTSSGSPYDPEQLTCAMLAVPLGTVVRVTTAAGGVVTVLVTDHGPYAGVDRIIDLSARAARIAGVGLTPVSVEVLKPA